MGGATKHYLEEKLSNRNKRRDFARIPAIIDIPDLIETQRKSYERFLQTSIRPNERSEKGLEEIFKSIFPIRDINKTVTLEYIGYEIGIWECMCGEYKAPGGTGVICDKCNREVQKREKYQVDECRNKGLTYADPLKVMVRLITSEKNEETGELRVRDVKEQKIYLGEIPMMTEKGTFIINGTERVIVSQMHRSPGVFFVLDKGKGNLSGKILYSARIIPYRGSWIDFEFDSKDILYIRIDRRRKLPVTILLKAMGLSLDQILSVCYQYENVFFRNNKFFMNVGSLLVGQISNSDIVDPKTGELLLKEGKRLTKNIYKKIQRIEGMKEEVMVNPEDLLGKIVAEDIVDLNTGEILLEINTEITDDTIKRIKELNIERFSILRIDELNSDYSLRNTLLIDKVRDQDEALREIYKRLRPGDPPTIEIARTLFRNLFFNSKRYDLSEVGRLKLNEKLGLDFPLEQRVLTPEDVIGVVKYLMGLRNGIGNTDDIDHLGNRRVRSVGEALGNHLRIGLVRMERAIMERMNIQDIEMIMPQDLVNSKPVTAAIKEFFGSSQLSQFMDQTNPLSEITHKRRLSALGPGGLTRERAQFEVRDVHPTHYGRLCPIETPEGPNIGLISSLSTYARVNEFGFIETPYRKVRDGKVTDEVEFLTAFREDKFVIAQANAELDDNNSFIKELVSARFGGEFIMVPPEKLDYMDVSPKQLVSVAASLIPFLENDDANRALMGSNMQRQAVPLLKAEAPVVGTGMEAIVARDSGAVIIAKHAGVIVSVDATRIVIRVTEDDPHSSDSVVDIYSLTKFQRSNQNTCINQKPIVSVGDYVKKGQVIADGYAVDNGELALGKNILVAFMPWGGYNFEDAIIISEKVVKEDTYTSIHIEEFEVEARDTKQGKEEFTRDIPNVSEEVLKDLDESGIIRIGARVKPDDILVGKVTPKGETQLSPEEKLLKAIFGEKAGDVRDTSLRVPPGVEGTVIDVKIFSRKGVEKDARSISIEEGEASRIEKDYAAEMKIIKEELDAKIRNLLLGKIATKSLVSSKTGHRVIIKGKKISKEMLNVLTSKELLNVTIEEQAIQQEINELQEATQEHIHSLKTILEERLAKLKKGDELAPGVIKMVKVYIAMKRKLSVGDKMAGRHGNKGVVSIIVPEEDMPYLPDGTPIELILNPLGVPSRMNVGQILETYLGLASDALNIKVMSPVFDGAREEDIKKLFEEAKIEHLGETILYDGKTGEPFDQKVVVGKLYLMKLHHLVDDKIHARSTGPYSLVTQQPLGGKAQFGGQRLGEMEVWALEGYGAAYILQEMLTVKSDDVEGRKRMYEAIVKGENTLHPSLPESFNVLVKELQSLALDVELIEGNEE